MILKANKKICFFDNKKIVYQQTNKDESTYHEKQILSLKENIFIDGHIDCTIYPGINSKRGNNDLLNSSFYDYKTYIPNLYSKSTVYLNFADNVTFSDNDVIQITDFMKNKVTIIFKTAISTNDGTTDQYGRIILGIQNKSYTTYAREIKKAILKNKILNPNKKFFVSVSSTAENYLYLTQSNVAVFQRDSNKVGGIRVSAPSNVSIYIEPERENSYKIVRHELDFKPFEENKSITKIFSNNPRIYNKTLGIDNLDYEEDIFFDDALTKYSADFYFKKPSEVDYPFTFNEKEINSLSTTINPFDTITILEGKITTEQSLLGIKGHLIYNSIDARNRCNKIKSHQEFIPDRSYNFTKNVKIDKNLLNNKEVIEENYCLEAFNDEEYVELGSSVVRKTPITVDYKFENQSVNNINKIVLNTSQSSIKTILSNNILYYNEDKMSSIPFFETDFENLNIFKDDTTYSKKNYIYNNFGAQRDEYSSKTPNSIIYLGVTE